MPPSIILEVLKITEAEMELRDATREAEQAREARTAEQVTAAAGPLAEEQEDLVFRTEDVIEDIRELPEGEFEFERSQTGFVRYGHRSLCDKWREDREIAPEKVRDTHKLACLGLPEDKIHS